jgi:hypothetical protein
MTTLDAMGAARDSRANEAAAYHREECGKVASESGAGGASEETAEVAVYEMTELEVASGSEPENRSFAEDERAPDQSRRRSTNPTRPSAEHQLLRTSPRTPPDAHSKPPRSVWGKAGASGTSVEYARVCPPLVVVTADP